MLEVIAAGVAGVAGHLKSRNFTRRRLRFTSWVERPGVGLFAGAATAVVAAPLVALLPFVGAGAGLIVGGALGAGVGTGIAVGARQARDGWVPED